MAKASTLSADLVDTSAKTLPTRQLASTKAAKAEPTPANNALVQVRTTEEKRRAIHVAAAQSGMKVNAFMVWLFDEYEARQKKKA